MTFVATPIANYISQLDQGWSPKCEPHSRTSQKQWAVLKTTAVQPINFDGSENKLLPTHLEPRPSIEVKTGDILITRAGPRSRVGITCVVRSTQPKLMLADKLYRIRVRDGLADPVWLAQMLNAPQALNLLEEMKTGISDSGLNLTQEKFLSLPLPIVAHDEQKRIAAKIDSLLTRSSRAVHELDRIPKLIERYKRAILAKAFTGELTADWRTTHDKQLGDTVALQTVTIDFSYGSSAKSSPLGRVPVLRMGNIQDGRLDWGELVFSSDDGEISKYRLRPGDVLFNRTNSPELVGKSALYNGEREAIFAGYLLADRRFSHADAAAQMTIISREIIKSQDQLNSLRQEEQKLLEARQSLDSSWLEMWAEAPFKPLSPDAMLERLNRRDEVLEAASRRDGFQLHLEALRQEETGTKASILVELTAIAVDTEALQSQPLHVVIEAAAAWQGRHETNASRRRQSEDRLRKIKPEKERKRRALEAAEKAQADWQTQWSATVLALSLDPGVQTEAAAAQLEDIDRLRETAREIDQLRNERIGGIERDVDAFAQDVKPLIAALANDLENTTPEEAIVTLERRLEDAKRVRDQRKAKDTTITNLEKRIEEFEGSVLQARETIRNLCETASVTDIDQLKIAIRNSDHLRELNQSLSTVEAALTREGDGLTTNELIEECAVADIDQIVAREETLQEDLKNLRAQFIEAAECRTHTRNALNAFGGEARAAEAAAVRQTALAEMREAVEEYIRIRTSATLLQWAIERYRREKQAPLLKRAGEIFAVLTGGSFIDLRLEFDEQDNPHLAGLRADGKLVRVTGMSTGTADQLYLALRVSSIEDYLGRSSAVPFVVDDLFINFDNERAVAGFKMLGDLAKKTQILFFTHHSHLVEIARSTLGNSVNIVSLLDRGLALAA